MTDTRTRKELLEEIADLEAKNELLAAECSELEDEKRYLEGELEDKGSPQDAVDAFLDEVTRPCGERKFTIPDNSRVHDAILALADAVGRNI